MSGRDPHEPGTPWPDPPTLPPDGLRGHATSPAGHPAGTLGRRLAGGPGSWQTDRYDTGDVAVADFPPDPDCGRVDDPDLGGIARQCGWRRPVEGRTDDRSEWMGYIADHGARLGRATEALAVELLASARELTARERAEAGGPR